MKILKEIISEEENVKYSCLDEKTFIVQNLGKSLISNKNKTLVINIEFDNFTIFKLNDLEYNLSEMVTSNEGNIITYKEYYKNAENNEIREKIVLVCLTNILLIQNFEIERILINLTDKNAFEGGKRMDLIKEGLINLMAKYELNTQNLIEEICLVELDCTININEIINMP